ncbi:MAG: tRNA 4-thiouridine(8) synthase ThiI [Actinomycetota bacterium]|nr:tRNA 4-thiouridine(8) synthase ThiI [Actinomycetota bacterium]
MSDALIVHYHEVGLKGKNREFFELALVRNLKRALRSTGYKRVRRLFGRIIVDLNDDALIDEALQRVARVFGVAYVGLGKTVTPDMAAIGNLALELLERHEFNSFSVRARRSYSVFDPTSREINIEVGQRIKETTQTSVDLSNPDVTVHVELFGKQGIVYCRRLEGAGGLPVGVSGKMLALISGGIDSPVAAWRMMRRGAEVELVHFHGQPYTDPSSLRQASDLAESLTRYQLRTVLHFIPLADAQREIVSGAPAGMRVVLYRRQMLRIAAALAADRASQAVVTGDSLGQVASQTIENIATVDAAVPGIQILRPLVGMDKAEIVELAQRIGTFDISTRKYQDCCVLFQPRSPVTRSTPEEADDAERDLDVEAMTGKALAGIETREFELPAPEGRR